MFFNQCLNYSSRDTYYRLWQGGLRIVNNSADAACTGAFTAYDLDPAPTQQGGYFYVTAGHCGEQPDDFWSQGGLYYGTAIGRKHNSGSSDGYAEHLSLLENVSADLYEKKPHSVSLLLSKD